VVNNVVAGGAADGKLAVGDMVKAVGGDNITSTNHEQFVARMVGHGDTATLVVERRVKIKDLPPL
jgi:C-terminal processing protease CtpA/Prc